MTKTPHISVQHLNVHIGNQHILKDITINIPDKKVTSIIGPSGCGKTTLLKSFNRLLDNTPDVKIDLKNDAGKNYSFLFTRAGQSYQLDAGTLPTGEYSYTASAKNGTRQFTTNGQLTVKALNLESRQSAANFQLLNNIAKQSGGQMLLPSQINKLADLIRKNDNIKTVVYEDKHYSDIIDVKWVFVVVLVLLSLEWFLRKREGEV